MVNKSGSMLGFYQRYGVAPVRQDISDLQAHFARRRVLYQQLGITLANFQGKRILEIGPGTGQNALFLTSLEPNQLVLVEPNPAGIAAIESNFLSHPEWRKKVFIQSCTAEEYIDHGQFDLVLCEGMIGGSGHPDPAALIDAVARNVKPGGMLVVTSMDYVSYLSEMLRRLLAVELTRGLTTLDERVQLLSKIFAPHLQTLQGLSRRIDDWVIDTLINPASVGHLVNFDDCINQLSPGFEVLGSSPRFLTDWTWYKQAALTADFFNHCALDCYWRRAHCFMDYRGRFPDLEPEKNKELMIDCAAIHHGIFDYEQTGLKDTRLDLLKKLHALSAKLVHAVPSAARSVAEVCQWLGSGTPDPIVVSESKEFGSWFGHGQIYISLVACG